MKLVSKSMLLKIIRILKWSKIIAKFGAIGTTVTGAVAAFSGSATTGIALSAAGATTYAATKGLSTQGYEKTKHIPPGRVNKAANLLRHQEIAKSSKQFQKGGKNTKMIATSANASAAMLYSGKQIAPRASSIASAALISRKK